MSVMATCSHNDEAMCLTCGLGWCFTCDPAPSGMCPVCHGRGYSTATICAPNPTWTVLEFPSSAG